MENKKITRITRITNRVKEVSFGNLKIEKRQSKLHTLLLLVAVAIDFPVCKTLQINFHFQKKKKMNK